MAKPMAASPQLARLEPFVGRWKTEGQVHAGRPGAAARFSATDSYEWLPGGHFLLHRFDAEMPDGRSAGIEVIGYASEDGSYSMHSFDNSGQATLMHGRVDNGTWTFMGEAVRFTGAFTDDGNTFAGTWQIREGTAWTAWMDVTLRKTAEEGGRHGRD